MVFEKNANFFAENWEKSQKIVIITSTTDWAKIRTIGDCLLLAFFENYRTSPQLCATFFLSIDYVLILAKKWVGLHFRRFFHKLIWSPCLQTVVPRQQWIPFIIQMRFFF
jgi:hypothetical protein